VSPAYELLAGPGSTARLYEDPSSLLEYVTDEDRAMLGKAIIEGAARGWSNPTLPTFRVYGADDDLHWISARVFPVRHANGAIYRVAGIAEDISERVKAEEEHLALQRQVLEARAAESLGVLAGGIAHDFNNLLMGVLGNLELVALDLPPDSPVLPPLDSAASAAQRAAELSGQMLQYSGKSILSPTQLELSAFVRENTGILQAVLSPGSILVTETAPDLPRISADAGQILRALVNLVTNAAEALSDGHGTVTISTGVKDCDAAYLCQSRLLERPNPGRYVWVQVTDTGRGMDMATQTRLFDPFFTTKFTGRGLGMPTVMGTVRAHGGAVLVDSTLGLGTTVRILLPAAAPEAELA
jgi:signal transduction histidine kinase